MMRGMPSTKLFTNAMGIKIFVNSMKLEYLSLIISLTFIGEVSFPCPPAVSTVYASAR